MGNGEKIQHTINLVKQEFDESGRFVDRRGLTWNSASQSTTVFLSLYPDLAMSVADTLSLKGESEGKKGREIRERGRERDGISID